MKFLSKCNHPGRETRVLVFAEQGRLAGQFCAKLVLTYDYWTIEGTIKQRHEPKPVELWVCFLKEDGRYKLHLQYPLHDLIYLLQ